MGIKKILSWALTTAMLFSVLPVSAEDNTIDSEKQVLYSNDFSSGLSGWGENPDYYILNRQLIFKNKDKNRKTSIIMSGTNVENGEIEFDLNVKNGNYFALIFRGEDENTHYALRMYYKSNKVMLLKKIKGGSYKTITNKGVTLEYGKTNRIGVCLVGSNITVRIDGEDVLTAQDFSIKSGKIGFDGYSAEAVVDNLEIFKMGSIQYDIVEVDKNVKPKRTIYVSPNGNNEDADGTETKPYKTLEAAKKKANSLKKGNTPVDVVFTEGVYNLAGAIELTESDSGSEGAPVRFIAKEGDKVVFSGAKRIDTTKFTPVTDQKLLSRMYPEVAGKVMQVDLKAQGFTRDDIDFTKYYANCVGDNLKPVQISLNGQMQKISRWPNSGYNIITLCEPGDNARNGGNINKGGTIYYTGIQPSRWLQAKDVFIEGFFCHAWAGEWGRLKEIDTLNSGLNFEYYTSYGITPNNRWAAVHLIEEIDIPSEWFIDFENLILYYYPTKELKADDVFEITTLKTNLMNIKNASNIEIEGIEFSMLSADPTIKSYNANGGNAINITDAKNVSIKDCTINHIGVNGININSNDVTIDGCIIHDIGYNAINIERAGDKASLTPSNVVIKNCQITDVCRNTGNNAYAGIRISDKTVDVTIVNNIIHNCINNAIRYGGIGHRIAYNEIHNSVNKASDAGAIYSGRNWTEYGTVTEYNYFHGIGDRNTIAPYQASSMFWDDYHSGNEFSHNISVMQNYIKTSHVHLGGGVDNIITGNTFVAALQAINANDRSSSVKDYKDYSVSTLKYGTIDLKDPNLMSKYPKMCTILERLRLDNGMLKMENTIGDNLVIDNTEGVKIASTLAAANTMNPTNNVDLGTDYSVFVDPENQDYRVTKEAKEKYNIPDDVLDEDFDLDLIGLQKEYKVDESKMKTTLLYPENGATGIPKSKAQIAWTKADLVDGYTYVVAKDPEFKNIVVKANTLETSVGITGLENDTTYYWKAYSYNESREIGCNYEAEGGVRSFTTAEFELLDKSNLEKEYKRLQEVLPTIKESDKPGQYRYGTIQKIKENIAKAEEHLAQSYGEQGLVDEFVFELNRFVSGIDAYINPGYTTLNLTSQSDWYASQNVTEINPINGGVTIKNTLNTEVTLRETLSNFNVMCFRTKVDTMDGWIAYGLRALDASIALYSQDAYYILIKKDIFELQKHGKIYATAPNNGKFEAGKWYDVQFGSITTENGVNMYFKLNDEVIFDYLDKNEPQYKPGMFAMFISGAHTIEIESAKEVSKDMYVMSDAIKAQINKATDSGDILNIESASYTEDGAWGDKVGISGHEGSWVRTTQSPEATAKWIMESGSKGNGSLYKVSYYHIPNEKGDKNVGVHLLGYGGEYKTTVDLSQGEEGWVELGTFTFSDADYIGRLSITFTASGKGEMNLSNVKFDKVTEGTNMLK